MKRLFWVGERFSWPFVVVLAYVSLSLVAVDYAWRNVTMPFETLFIYAVAVNTAVIFLLIFSYRIFRRRRRVRP